MKIFQTNQFPVKDKFGLHWIEMDNFCIDTGGETLYGARSEKDLKDALIIRNIVRYKRDV